MGGRSSSASNTTTTTNTKNTHVSNAFNDEMNGVLVSGIENSNVTITDGGSVQAALKAMTDASKSAIDGMVENNKYNTDLSKYVVGENTSLAKTVATGALNNAQSATTDAMDIMKNLSLNSDAGTAQEMTKYFMFGAVALAVAVAFRGKI